MNLLVQDNILCIASYLDTNNKIIFLSSSKEFHSLKNKVYYHDQIKVTNKKLYGKRIDHLWYYDRFTNIRINNIPNKFKYPKYVTHLIFSDHIDQEIKNIPNSITHLTFGNGFNRS